MVGYDAPGKAGKKTEKCREYRFQAARSHPYNHGMDEPTTNTDDISPLAGYDFYDFGCSTGTNIAETNSVLPNLRGLGIDIAPAKVAAARDNGHDAIVFDILQLPDEKCVDFVTMSHFLEHLSSLDLTRKIVAKAISISREFVLIRQPWFDSDGELLRRGFKFHWSHWLGHPNKMTTLDFHSILNAELEAGYIDRFSIHGRSVVTSSRHPSIIPLQAPKNQPRYDRNKHGPKTIEDFSFAAYKEVVSRVDVDRSAKADALMSFLAPLNLIFDSKPSI